MLRFMLIVSAFLPCLSALGDEALISPANEVKAPIDGNIQSSAKAPVGLEANAGESNLPPRRARIFSFYAQTDEAPEIASLRGDGTLHLSKGVPVEEAAETAAAQLKTENADLCKFASASNIKQAYTIVINGKNMSWRVGLTVEGGVEFQKPNLTYREIRFFHLLASHLTCPATQSAKSK